MTKAEIIKYVLIVVVGAFYIYYTIRSSVAFKKTQVFSRRLRIFHLIMFWLVPFIWIWLIKSLSKSEKGSHEIEEKKDPIPFSGLDIPN